MVYLCVVNFFSTLLELFFVSLIYPTESRQRRKADRVLVEREDRVHVLHVAVSEQPDVASETEVLARQRADTVLGRARRLAEVKAEWRTSASVLQDEGCLNAYLAALTFQF